jgi:hypothetical protein
VHRARRISAPGAQTIAESKAGENACSEPESGPKIEIAIEETAALTLPNEAPASPCLSALSSLTHEPECKYVVDCQ